MTPPTFADLMNDLAAAVVGFPAGASALDLDHLENALENAKARLDLTYMRGSGEPGQYFAKALIASVMAFTRLGQTEGDLFMLARRTMLAGADAYVEHYRHTLRQGVG